MTRYFISDGISDLDVFVDDDADLDGTFDAVDADTGERLRINGWLISDFEEIA